MSTSGNIFIDPGSTDAVPVYIVVSSGVTTYLPRAVLNDSLGNELTSTNPLNITGSITAYQGASPWHVIASISGAINVSASVNAISTVFQGGAPWLVNASMVGVPHVIASISGIPQVNASIIGTPIVNQGSSPWVVGGTITIGAGAGTVLVTNVTLAALGTVYQGNPPWLVNASVVGIQAVTASTSGYASNQADSSAIGALTYNNISLVATCVTIKTGTTNLYGYHFYNSGSSVTYISLFAQTLATMGITTPNTILALPAGGWADTGFGVPVGYNRALLMGASASINGNGNPSSPVLANVYYR